MCYTECRYTERLSIHEKGGTDDTISNTNIRQDAVGSGDCENNKTIGCSTSRNTVTYAYTETGESGSQLCEVEV